MSTSSVPTPRTWRAPGTARRRPHRVVAGLLAVVAVIATAAVSCSQPPACLVLSTCSTGNPYTDAVVKLPGLQLWAPLDEAAGPGLHEFGPRQANGSTTGAPVFGATDSVASPTAGRRAVTFPPGRASATFPSAPSLNLSTTPSDRWLVAIDARVETMLGYPVLLAKGDRSTDGFALFADPSGSSIGFIIDGHQYAWGGVSLKTTRHLVVSWDGLMLRFDVDGTELGRSGASSASVRDAGPLSVAPDGGLTLSKLAIASSADAGTPAALYDALHSSGPATTTTSQRSTGSIHQDTTSALSNDQSTTTPPRNDARLAWSDEFDGAAGSGVDTSRWEQEVGAPDTNGRVEYLTPGTHNVALDGKGNLVITARKEPYGGRSFTSGRIESTWGFTTGYLEFRAKVPTWAGTMPGLWTYGLAGYGAQTGFSEIDALEIETGADPSAVRQTIHGAMPDQSTIWQLGWSQNRVDFDPNRPGDGWHTYGAFVDPADQSVTFYADGVPRAHYAKGQQPAGATWPYGTNAQKMIVEIEMGGYSGAPSGDQSTDTLQLDYVRVYDRPPY